MASLQGASFWYMCVLVTLTLHHAYCGPADLFRDVDNGRTTEYINIHQETRLIRQKRDSVDHVSFPPVMDFSFHFEERQIRLRLKRSEYMTSNVRLSDENGPIAHDLARKTGIYSDVDNRAAFVVHCEDNMEHCTLTGSMEKDGQTWEITPELHTPRLHKATEQKSDGIFFGNDAIPVPYDADIQVITRNETRRYKRDIPDCDIVECFVIVDESVWEFFLTKEGNNVTKAEEELTKNYLALYTQADLHYDFVSFRRPGTCIRLFPIEINIEKTTADSWSFPHQISIQGQTGVLINAVPSIVTCGAKGNSFRTATKTIDLTQCYTRKDIAWNENTGTEYFPAYRALGFKDVACNVSWNPYTAAVMESYGEKVELLLAHEIAHGLGADHDGTEGCIEADGYIMQKLRVFPADDLKLNNIWYFSTCSLNAIYEHLDRQPSCLRENSFTVSEYDAFKDQPLAGTLYNWEEQCVLRFGTGSVKCDPTGANRTYFPDMCSRGIYCTLNGACVGQNRPYDGTECGDSNAYCLKGTCNNPAREIGGACECHNECSDPSAMCDVTSKTCVCQDGFYNNNTAGTGACLPKIGVGSSCPSNDSCRDPNSFCDGNCVCQSGYYTEGDGCELLKCVGETCASAGQCKGANVECSGTPTTCRCPSDRYLDSSTGNCLTSKSLGESCEPGQCGPTNSVCDSTSNTCKCQEGFFDDNAATAGGNCLPKVALGAFCTEPDACSDPNAECSTGTCSCKSDFFENSGTCDLLKCVGETCSSAGQCKGANVECSGTPTTCRCPSDRYLDSSTGNCLTSKSLGESCEPGQCGPTNSVCDSTSNTCKCQEGFFDDNGATAGGNCSPKVALGASCPEPDACSDPNAECSAGTCSCKSDFFENSGTCDLLKCVGETCASAGQCKGANVECSGTPTTCRCPSDRYLDSSTGNCLTSKSLGESCEPGQCGPTNSVCDSTSNTCKCQEGFFDDNGATAGGNCSPKVALGASCPEPDACSDPNAECSAGTCSCKSDFFENSGTCDLLKCVGETCASAGQCKGANVECSGTPTTCRCPSDRYLDSSTGNCLTSKSLGESCEPRQCGPTNSVCDSTSNTCKCQEGFFDDNGATAGGNCSPKVALGAACPQPDACSDPNAECSAGTCSCKSDFFENSGTCDLLKCVGETCASAGQCKGANVECSGTPTTCRCPSDRYLDSSTGNCLTSKSLGESCEPRQCGPTNSVCDSTSNTCKCQEGFFDDNGATAGGNCSPKVALGAVCPQPDACSDPNAECSAGTCSCKSDFFENSGTCDLLKCVGETCASAGQCKGANVECSGTPTTCRCPSDRYLDSSTGNCLTSKSLGESCEPRQCGPTNSVCDSTSNTCKCQEGFFDDNGATAGGNCSPKVALGAACPQPDACSDPNAECSAGTCSCKSDFFENSGTCDLLKCVGETCASAGQCKGANVECSGTPTTCRCPSDRYLDSSTGNCLTSKSLGESCEPRQCGPTNSVCDSTSNTCKCQEGFFDDNGATAGGNCSPKVALGAACPQPDACSDPNAECSAGTCSCKSDFFENSGTCNLLKCVGETCASAGQCKGANVECSGTPTTCRCPSDRYLDSSTGNCLTSKSLGESCEPRQCGPTNSVCDSTSNTCKCQEGFFDDNGATAGGNCSPKVALGAACPQPDACSDPNAECSAGTCSCKSDFFENSGTCDLLKCVGETCASAGQCKGANVECSGTPTTCRCPSDRYLDSSTGNCLTSKSLGESCEPRQCGPTNSVCDSTSNTCKCQEGFFDDNGATAGGNCSPKVALGAACPQPDACSDPNAECSAGTCSCKSDFFENSGTCDLLKCVGETCASAGQCKGANVECSGTPTTCRCPSDRYLDSSTGNCLTSKSLGESCEPRQCGPTNSVCDSTSNTCKCQEGFFDDNGATAGGNCSPKVALGAACPQPDACSDPNAECSAGTCSCKSDFFENSGTCDLLKCVGETCASAGQCKGANVECSGTPTTCRCPSDRYLDSSTGNCLTSKSLGESCEPGQCGPTNSVCDSTSNTCKCQEGFFDDNGATAGGNCSPKVALGASCPLPDACSDPNAECSAGTCSCKSDFFQNSGTCNLLKCVGETCASAGQCKGANVECSGTPTTCRCPSDRYLDSSTGNCLTSKSLGESCEPRQCGPTNSVCDSTSNTCKCQEGFFDDNGATAGGNCSPKVALGAACPQPDACSDPNAECSAGTCSCKSDFFENSGTCDLLKCVGETCASAGQCKGANVECSGTPTTCRCPSDRYLDSSTGNCLTSKSLGESCEPGQCGPTNSVCDSTSNTCKCQEGFFDDNGATAGGNCSPKVALGASCPQPDACSDPNAECSAGTCSCKSDFFENSGTCNLLKCVGETCASAGQCKGANVECSGTPTTCRCPSDRYLDSSTGNCLTSKSLGESCEPRQCGPTNSVCDSTSNTCKCQEGFFDDNGATAGGNCSPKVALGASCPQPDACSDPNAECSAGTCSCKSDFFENSGTCNLLKCVGETCASAGQCKGANVECSGTPTTCRCPSDRYLDSSAGNCLTSKSLGESCEPRQCGPTNSVCDSTSNTCKCQEGFFDDNGATAGGNCSPKVALGASCPQPDACSDPNAECSAGTCSCKSDFFENSGTCDLLKCVGETCSSAGQCKGANVECSGTPTTCRCPSDRYLDSSTGNCLTKKAIGDNCEPGQCAPSNSICDPSTTKCACGNGFNNNNGVCDRTPTAPPTTAPPPTTTAPPPPTTAAPPPPTTTAPPPTTTAPPPPTTTAPPTAPPTTSSSRCRPSDIYKDVVGMQDWCDRNCPGTTCLPTHCVCT